MNTQPEELGVQQRWLIVIAVMSATLMQVLDITIVNVALPHMQGALGATPDQISWTLTAYLVSSAIIMPLTGYFADKFGRKKYLLLCISGFTLASAFCGASQTLVEIVFFRFLQGIFGAALVPLSQSIMADVYLETERPKAMAIWGAGVMIGPILGPTLGGYLTDIANWRWIFYVNVPFGIVATLLAWQAMPQAPKKERMMDWLGLIFLSTSIGALQYFLDRGNQQDWFDARDIQCAAVLMVIGFIAFIWHCWRNPEKTVFNLRIFKDRNFTVASLLIAAMGLGLFGTMVIQPLMLEELMNYPVLTTGLVMSPRGISGLVSMLLVAKIGNRVDPRWLIIAGILLNVIGTSIGIHYSLYISPGWVMMPLILQGFGLSLIFVPLSTVAFSTLAVRDRDEAAGLFSLLRTIGSSIGISVVVLIFTRDSQGIWNQLSGFLNPFNPALQHYFTPLNLSFNQPLSIAILGQELLRQAQMMAFVNAYTLICCSFVAMIPLVFLIKKNSAPSPKADHTPDLI